MHGGMIYFVIPATPHVRTCTPQLRVVINKTLSLYQPGSRTILYDSLVPTDANVRHSANIACNDYVNGVPTRRRMVSSRFASDYIGASDRLMWSGHYAAARLCARLQARLGHVRICVHSNEDEQCRVTLQTKVCFSAFILRKVG